MLMTLKKERRGWNSAPLTLRASLLWFLGECLLLRSWLRLGGSSLVGTRLSFAAANLVEFGLGLCDLRFGVLEGTVRRRLLRWFGIAFSKIIQRFAFIGDASFCIF